jgi:hypothetical protein
VYVSIDRYHQGQLVFAQGEWRAHLNAKTILQGDDGSVLIEIIEAY